MDVIKCVYRPATLLFLKRVTLFFGNFGKMCYFTFFTLFFISLFILLFFLPIKVKSAKKSKAVTKMYLILHVSIVKVHVYNQYFYLNPSQFCNFPLGYYTI